MPTLTIRLYAVEDSHHELATIQIQTDRGDEATLRQRIAEIFETRQCLKLAGQIDSMSGQFSRLRQGGDATGDLFMSQRSSGNPTPPSGTNPDLALYKNCLSRVAQELGVRASDIRNENAYIEKISAQRNSISNLSGSLDAAVRELGSALALHIPAIHASQDQLANSIHLLIKEIERLRDENSEATQRLQRENKRKEVELKELTILSLQYKQKIDNSTNEITTLKETIAYLENQLAIASSCNNTTPNNPPPSPAAGRL